MKTIPNVPPEYLGTAQPGGSPFVTHIDAIRFKAEWDSGRVRDFGPVVASREQGVKYSEKHTLRRILMNFAVKSGVAVTKAIRQSAWA